jgi:palmitoyl-protein thioesterase
MFMNINDQVANFAAQLANDTKLKHGFNLIGHSQGGLITRAYIERYNDPPVYNWVSWAGPQGGVFGVPDLNAYCPVEDCPWLNILFDQLLIDNTWLSQEVQANIAFASYWHDPLDQAAFVSDNIFLADINNARDNKNATYKHNIISLNTALLIYSTNDHIVVPKESPWCVGVTGSLLAQTRAYRFSFFDYVNASDASVDLYSLLPDWTDDWIGMRTLAAQKKLQMCVHALRLLSQTQR